MYDQLKASLRKFEGSIPHMYLDTLGFVTVGVGHLLPLPVSACGLEFHIRDLVASQIEIAAKYAYVKSLEKGRFPAYYLGKTALRLDDPQIDALLDSDIRQKVEVLAKNIAGFGDLPEAAQQALLDMAFNIGERGLLIGFPHLMVAVSLHKWAQAAELCHRRDIPESRNIATANLFRSIK